MANEEYKAEGVSMRRNILKIALISMNLLVVLSFSSSSDAWFDETHLAIAKAAGYAKWFNAAGPDMIKEKMFNREGDNQFCEQPPRVNNNPGNCLGPGGKI